jgi:hypothetical protein
MPSWGAAPRPASSRGKWIALGVGAVALAGIVAVVIWLAVRPDPSKGNASAGTSTTTSTTSTTESTETSSTTTPSTDSDDEARLRAMLPKGYTDSACRHGEPPAGGIARLDCKANTLAGGPSAASYVVFSDQSSLDDTFDNLIRAGGLKLVNCPGLDENPTAWHLRTTPSVDEGRVTCGQYEKNPDLYTLMWTHNSKLFFGGADGADLDGLYKWWQEHT